MKKVYLLLFVLSINFILSQNPKEYENKDTIYILYDIKEKFDDLHTKHEVYKYNEIYTYVFPDAKTIIFNVNLNMSVKFPNVLTKKRCYLDNKSLITLNEIHSLGFNKLINLIHSKHLIVYLINKKDLKKRKIILKQATLLNIENIEM